MEQIENRMVVDSEWDGMEYLMGRNPERASRRRLQLAINEIEQRMMFKEDEREDNLYGKFSNCNTAGRSDQL